MTGLGCETLLGPSRTLRGADRGLQVGSGPAKQSCGGGGGLCGQAIVPPPPVHRRLMCIARALGTYADDANDTDTQGAPADQVPERPRSCGTGCCRVPGGQRCAITSGASVPRWPRTLPCCTRTTPVTGWTSQQRLSGRRTAPRPLHDRAVHGRPDRRSTGRLPWRLPVRQRRIGRQPSANPAADPRRRSRPLGLSTTRTGPDTYCLTSVLGDPGISRTFPKD